MSTKAMADDDPGCLWTCEMDDTPEKRHALAQRQKLAQDHRAAWLRSFDAHGRYYDPATGFWESLRGEIRLDDGTWCTVTAADVVETI